MLTLGEYILNYRKEHNISMREFARMTNISVQYISNIEKGVHNNGTELHPTIPICAKVASAIGMSTLDLLSLLDDVIDINPLSAPQEEKPAPVRSELYDELYQEVFNMLLQLPAEDIPLVVAYIQGLRAKREG